MPVSRQQRAFYKTFSKHGNGNTLIELSPKDVALLVHIAYLDLFEDTPEWFVPEFNTLASSYFYDITPSMIETLPAMSE